MYKEDSANAIERDRERERLTELSQRAYQKPDLPCSFVTKNHMLGEVVNGGPLHHTPVSSFDCHR